MKQVRTRLTYANVVSSLALFLVVAGGSAFAANQLAKNSVGSKQIKKNAVIAAKIKDGAVTPAKLSDAARAGMVGAQGVQGPQGAKGDQGEPGPFPTTLPAGKTIVGLYDIRANATAIGQTFVGAVSYNWSAPGQTVIYLEEGDSDPNCPGNVEEPSAPLGYTCFYEGSSQNAGSRFINVKRPVGVSVAVASAASGPVEIWGTWAATGK